jgi:hypothetical protein
VGYKIVIWAGIIATVALIVVDIAFQVNTPAEGVGLLTVGAVLWHHIKIEHGQQ